jgi:tetratricopeptide (TPR) repeat protein
MKTIKDLRLKLKTGKQKEVYGRIVDRPSLSESYKFLARLFQKEGDLGQAEEVLRLARHRFPKDRLVREQLAALYQTMGRIARAVDIYRELIREGESWSAYVRLARILRNKGEVEAAVTLFKSIPFRHPFKERTYPFLYNIFFVLGDHRRGIQNLKEAIRHSGPSHRFIKDLGRLYMKAGDKLEGIKYLKRSLEYQADDLDAVKLIGLAQLDLGNYGLARRYFKKILKKDPGSYQAQIQLAELCLLQGRLAEARDWLDKIKRNQKRAGEPWDSRSKLAMGEYYLKKGKFEKAVAVTAEGLGETPFYYPMEIIHAHSILEAAYREMGDEFKAGLHSLIHRALAENPDAFSSMIQLAENLEKKRELSLAKEVLEQLLVTFPGNILVLVNLAEAQFSRGMTESAIRLARAATRSSDSFVRDKIQALKLLARISRANKEESAARNYERQAEKLLSGKE